MSDLCTADFGAKGGLPVKEDTLGAGEAAQLVKRLLAEARETEFGPQHPHQNPGVVVWPIILALGSGKK